MKLDINQIMFIIFGLFAVFMIGIVSLQSATMAVNFEREADTLCQELGYDEYKKIGVVSYCLEGKTLIKVLKTCGASDCVLYEVAND